MLNWLRPGRTADRLILRVCDVSDEIVAPSAFANSVTYEWMDAMVEAEARLVTRPARLAAFDTTSDRNRG